MKILFFTDNFYPEVNAPASRTYEHSLIWSKFGHDVTVVTCFPNFPKGMVFEGYKNCLYKIEFIHGIKVIRVATYIAKNSGIFLRSLDFLSFMVSSFITGLFLKKRDLIIGTSPQFFTILSVFAISKVKRMPYIFEVRDLWPESISELGVIKKNNIFINILSKIEKLLYQHATKIITVTNSFKEILIRRGIQEDKIHVITNGVNFENFIPAIKNHLLVSKLKIKNKFVIGYIGTIGIAHSLETIIEAAKKIQSLNNNIIFLIIGDGARKSFLYEITIKNCINNIIFLDTIAKELIPNYWNLLDLSVVHLQNKQLFKTVIPSKIFESMAMGVPILHGVQGESANIITENNIGILFESENSEDLVMKILSIYNNNTLLEVLKNNCIENSKKYDRKILAKNMLNIFETIKI